MFVLSYAPYMAGCFSELRSNIIAISTPPSASLDSDLEKFIYPSKVSSLFLKDDSEEFTIF